MPSAACTLLTTLVAATAAQAQQPPRTKEIAPDIFQPIISLGTCCGSNPAVGLLPWLQAGGVGIDTAYDYNDQTVIAGILGTAGIERSKLFITSKVPAGFGSAKDCAADPQVSLKTVQTNLKQLNTSYLDLVLLHKPCKTAAQNNGLWKGLEMAKTMGLVKAIGVSNYKSEDLEALDGTVPAVNQCLMSVSLHDTKTIDYCAAHNITYEAYEAMRTCPFKNPKALAIAANNNVSDTPPLQLPPSLSPCARLSPPAHPSHRYYREGRHIMASSL